MPDSLVGTELESRYLVERELGEGGMGRVYAALDKQLGRGKADAGCAARDQRHLALYATHEMCIRFSALSRLV